MPPSRKRQTRLALTPLPSSSPAARIVLDRAAAVLHEDSVSPAKKRRLPDQASPRSSSPPNKTQGSQSEALPTPVPSSQVQPKEREYDVEYLSSNSDSATQTLDTRHKSNRHNREATDPATPSKTAGVQHGETPPDGSIVLTDGYSEVSATLATSKEHEVNVGSVSISSEDEIIPQTNRRRRTNVHFNVINSDEDSSDAVHAPETPHRRENSKRAVGRSPRTLRDSRPNFSPHVNPRHFLLGGTSGYAPIRSSRNQKTVTPTKLKNLKSITPRTRSSPRRPPEPLSSGLRRSSRLNQDVKTSRSKALMLDNSGPNNDSDSDSSTEPNSPTRGKGITRRRQSSIPLSAGNRNIPVMVVEDTSDSNGSDEDVVISPAKRRRVDASSRHSPSASVEDVDRQAEEDIEDDLRALRDTKVQDKRTRGKATTTKKDAAKKQLEVLKRRRAEQQPQVLPSESETSTSDPDGDGGAARSSKSETNEDEEDSSADSIAHAATENLDEYEEDFVVEDEDSLIGAPHSLNEIPIEFTRHAHKKPKEYFKDIVEWMVHNKLNPAFARDDPLYRVAFAKLDDVARSYSSSQFLSAAWTGDFAKALKARPEMLDVAIDAMPEHKCDACNRSGHPPKFRITFLGKAYHRQTLEDVSDDEEDDDENGDAQSRDSKGNSIPSSEMVFFVGKFCRANAIMAHPLLHWRHRVNESVLQRLRQDGHFSREKIIERDGWRAKKRSEYANKVVDELEENRVMREFYEDFKIPLELARDAKPARYRGR